MIDVAILGCGYVGTELGRQLSPAHEVVGVRRSQSGIDVIEAAGFTGVKADLTDAGALESVPDTATVVFAASSGGRGAKQAREVYVAGQRTVLDHFAAREHPPERYVYTSSTGVYGDHGGDWVDETTPLEPTTEKTRVLAEAEELALTGAPEQGIDGTVVRLAGLYGPERYRLRRYIEGPVTEGYLNMIHRDDAAGIIRYLLTEDIARGETILGVDDEPVEKWAFADWLAEQCGVGAPPKRTVDERLESADLSETARRRLRTSKRCSNARLRERGYDFTYPTFRDGYRDAIAAYRDDD
jgi:nucleoside-diphosphate-sugar epimerase